MKTIRFTQTVPRRRHGAEQIFEEGQKYSLADDVANHYLKRGQAVIATAVKDPAPTKPAEMKAEASTENANGDTVDSSTDVVGQDGGGAGERTKPAASASGTGSMAKKAVKKAAKKAAKSR